MGRRVCQKRGIHELEIDELGLAVLLTLSVRADDDRAH